MATAPRHVADGNLSWLLTGLIDRVPHAHSGLLLSSDGIVKAAENLEESKAGHLASICSGLFSLGKSAAQTFQLGAVKQIMIEMNTVNLVVSSAGEGAVLAVLTGREVNAAVLGYEMGMLVKGVRSHFATPARERAVT